MQLTATGDPNLPSLIVNVATTPATTPDDNILAVVHASLARRDLLPGAHPVGKGYTDSQVLVDSQRPFGIAVIGPVADDPSWPARAGKGFAKAAFLVDRDQQVATRRPAGKRSISWLSHTDPASGMAFERGAVLPRGLHALPGAGVGVVHPAQARAADPRAAGTRAVRSLAGGPAAAGGTGVARPLRAQGRDRGHPRAGDPPLRAAAPLALSRSRQDPSAAHRDGGGGDQPGAAGWASGGPAGPNPRPAAPGSPPSSP